MIEKKDGGQKHTTMTDSGMFESMNCWILSGGIIVVLKCSGFSCTKKGEKVCISEQKKVIGLQRQYITFYV